MIRLYQLIKNELFITKSQLMSLVQANKVFLNGQAEKQMSKYVFENDEIVVDGRRIIYHLIDKQYFLFYKPRNIICTNDTAIKESYLNYLELKQRMFCVGRLDKDSQGLIILTNDGELFNKIINAQSHIEKEYLVTVNKKITDDFILKMANGVPILKTITNSCHVEKVDLYTFKIVLTQGLNRQIRRMCKILSYEVVCLERIRIKNICSKMRPGEIRPLLEDEIKDLYEGAER